jgi:hypothetical protein
MNRNSTTLFLESTGATTPVPWVNNEPDFTGFTDPTLSVLKMAWQEFLDSGEELEVILDPEPLPPALVEDWPNFSLYLFGHPAFVTYGVTANTVNPWMLPAVVERYGRVLPEGLAESNFPFYWNIFCQALSVTTEHRNEWADMADTFNLRPDFVALLRGTPLP